MTDIPAMMEALEPVLECAKPEAAIWLHPEWSVRKDEHILTAILGIVKADPRIRAGWQLHKLYQADAQDLNARIPVPLGGDPRRGESI